jgi:hypothetical protein
MLPMCSSIKSAKYKLILLTNNKDTTHSTKLKMRKASKKLVSEIQKSLTEATLSLLPKLLSPD